MTRKFHGPTNPRRRTNRAVVRRRIEQYPSADWLVEEYDDQGQRAHFHATQAEDFPAITRSAFVLDLHRIAREATRRARASGEDQGWIATTSTAGYPDDELHFAFMRAPFEECPAPRNSETGRVGLAHAATASPASPAGAPNLDEAARLAAWQNATTQALWCHTPTGAYNGHQVGHAPSTGCVDCADRTARTVTTTVPPAYWTPGDPIPDVIA